MDSSIYNNGTYLDNNPTWHEQDSPWKAEQIIKIISRNGLLFDTICEVGCGAGEVLNQLYQRLDPGKHFTGYEISPQAYEICRRKEKDRLEFILSDITEKEDTSYDLLLCIDVFEHVEDYFGFLRAIRHKAEHKIFNVPIEMDVNNILRNKLLYKREKIGHIHFFTKETALATLQDVGYEIVDYYYIPGDLELPPKSLISRMARVPRKLLAYANQDLAARLMGGWSLLVLAK